MKINILSIVFEHFQTLKAFNESKKTNKVFREDFLVFILLPFIVSAIAAAFGIQLNKDTYGISISVFSIFSALLLNVQIALFSIYQRGWSSLKDTNLNEIQKQEIKDRNDLLGEVNTNISYLIVVSCIGVTLFLILYISDPKNKIMTFISYFLYLHFLFTLLMVIKRAHALFGKEYTKG